MIYTFIVVEYHISIYDINGKSDLICHDKNSITIYTHHLVRQTVLTTCLGMLDRIANTLANSSNRFLTIIFSIFFLSLVLMSSGPQVCPVVPLQDWWKATEASLAEGKRKLLPLLNKI